MIYLAQISKPTLHYDRQRRWHGRNISNSTSQLQQTHTHKIAVGGFPRESKVTLPKPDLLLSAICHLEDLVWRIDIALIFLLLQEKKHFYPLCEREERQQLHLVRPPQTSQFSSLPGVKNPISEDATKGDRAKLSGLGLSAFKGLCSRENNTQKHPAESHSI